MQAERDEKNPIPITCSVMVGLVSFVALAIALAVPATAFPAHISLAGLSREELDTAMAGFGQYSTPPPPPGPLEFGGTKLVNDAAHPFIAPGADDIRGPCPALNTLANHGVCVFFLELSLNLNLTALHSTSTAMALILPEISSERLWKVRLSHFYLCKFMTDFS
jgi:hypothetical protein